jgi:hypothetical protein
MYILPVFSAVQTTFAGEWKSDPQDNAAIQSSQENSAAFFNNFPETLTEEARMLIFNR